MVTLCLLRLGAQFKRGHGGFCRKRHPLRLEPHSALPSSRIGALADRVALRRARPLPRRRRDFVNRTVRSSRYGSTKTNFNEFKGHLADMHEAERRFSVLQIMLVPDVCSVGIQRIEHQFWRGRFTVLHSCCSSILRKSGDSIARHNSMVTRPERVRSWQAHRQGASKTRRAHLILHRLRHPGVGLMV